MSFGFDVKMYFLFGFFYWRSYDTLFAVGIHKDMPDQTV